MEKWSRSTEWGNAGNIARGIAGGITQGTAGSIAGGISKVRSLVPVGGSKGLLAPVPPRPGFPHLPHSPRLGV